MEKRDIDLDCNLFQIIWTRVASEKNVVYRQYWQQTNEP